MAMNTAALQFTIFKNSSVVVVEANANHFLNNSINVLQPLITSQTVLGIRPPLG